MLFGLPLAVSDFNRLPMLMQAVVRRLFCIVVSLYFDDITQQDWAALAEDLNAERSLSEKSLWFS